MACCNDAPPAQPPAPPSWGTRIVSLGAAAVRFAAGGFRPVSAADLKIRLAECSACPMQAPQGLCAACGCVLSIKAAMPAEQCPQGRWPLLTV